MSKIGALDIKSVVNSSGINPFGGIYFVIEAMRKKALASIFTRHLGRRPKQSKYEFSDVFLGWIYSNLCGSKRLENMKKKKRHFKNLQSWLYPSPDTTANVFKSLATLTEIFKEKTIGHEFNINMPMNCMMLDVALELGTITKDRKNVVDYDNVILFNEKQDSRMTYKKAKGSQPGVCLIGRCPCYIENRNGNSSARLKLEETVSRGFGLLKSKGVRIGAFRSDSAAYQLNVLKLVDGEGADFFIRIIKSGIFVDCCEDIGESEWSPIKISRKIRPKGAKKGKGVLKEVMRDCCSFEYIPFRSKGNEKSYRAVVTRTKQKGYYTYWGILTSDWEMSNQEVFSFFAMRGLAERSFDELKNHFNWARTPFSYLNQNTVFLIASAIAYIIFQHVITAFCLKIDFIKSHNWLQTFIDEFIMVPARWDEDIGCLEVYSDEDYGALIRPGA